jgi:copper chaperone NosL
VTRRAVGIMMIPAFCLLGFLLTSFPLGAAERGAPKPNAQDKCPVCGMFVAKYPDWTTAILFRDGSHVFFDGAKDLFKYLLDPKRYYSARKREDIAAVMVKEYYGLSWIDGRKAWYILGSDVFGPMGRELIALETEVDAKEFMKDHKGKKIIKFSDVTSEVMKTID